MNYFLSRLNRLIPTFALVVMVVVGGILLPSHSASAAPLCNDYQTRGNGEACGNGQVCVSDGETEFGFCTAYDLKTDGKSSTSNSIAFDVSSIAHRVQTINVSGCLGPLASCGTPAANPTNWINFPSGTSVSAVTSGLRPSRLYQYSFYSTFETTNATHNDSIATIPYGPITPTVSNIGDTTATVNWTTTFSGNSLVHYGLQPPRWTAEPSAASPLTMHAIHAISTGEAWAVGANGMVLVRPRQSQLVRDWTVGSGTGTAYLTDVDSTDGSTVWAAGFGGVVYRSDDRGQTWSLSNTGTNDDLYGIYSATANTAWVAGRNHRVMFFNGSAWQTMKPAVSGFSLNSIWTLDNRNVWAVGSNGQVVFTSNQGANWSATTLPDIAGADVRTIASLDGQTLWAGGSNGGLWRFSGTDWALVPSGTNETIEDISMVSTDEFYYLSGTRIGHYKAGTFTYSSQVSTGLGEAPAALSFAHGAQGIVVGNTKVAAYGIPEYIMLASGTTNHQVQLTGLSPNTTYYYAAMTTGSGVTQGGFGAPFTTTSPDIIPPEITITDPASGTAYTRNDTYIIRGTISDNLRLASLTCEDVTNHITVSPSLITVTPALPTSSPSGVTATWTADVYLGTVDNARDFTCTVSDGNFANNQSATARVVRDRVQPTLTITYPDWADYPNPVPGPTVTVTGDVNDSSGIQSMEYVLNNGTPVTVTPPGGQGGTYSFTLQQASLNNGDNDITVRATDPAGNTAIAGTLFWFDAPGYRLALNPSTQTAAAGTSVVYTATVTPVGGFTGPVQLSLSGQPAGSTVTFEQNPVVLGATPVDVDVRINTLSAPTGTFTLTLSSTTAPTPTASTTATLILTTAPDFSLSSSPVSRTVLAGNGVNYTISATANATYTGTVGSFTVALSPNSPLPTGVGATFNPGSLSLTPNGTLSTVLNITTTAATPNGTYQLRVSGTDQAKSLTRFTDITLVVNQPPDVNLSVLPATQTISAGSGVSANYNGKAIALNGYNRLSTVSASVGSTIPGLTIDIQPNVFVPATGPSGTDFTMSIAADSRVPGATYTVTVTLRADDSSLTKTATVELIIIGDTTPPIISITVPDVSPNFDRATISWRTNELANSRIEVFTDAARTIPLGPLGDPSYELSRSLVYQSAALQPLTKYYVTVSSADQAGNTATVTRFDDGTDLTFTTLDEPDFTPPTIRIDTPNDGQTVVGNVTITGVASDNKFLSKIEIRVIRPDGTEARYQKFDLGGVPNYNFVSNWDSLTDRINGLYTITANATDTAGNPAPEARVTINVENDLTPPDVEDGYPQAVDLSCDLVTNKCQVTILWFTDDKSTTRVEIAKDNDYFARGYDQPGFDRDDSDPSTSPSVPVHEEHRLTLTGLDRNELYHYRITSCNISGDCTN